MTMKETYITERVRVVLDSTPNGFSAYSIRTEQKVTGYPWETDENGWRMCVGQGASTWEDAIRKYTEQVESERRFH